MLYWEQIVKESIKHTTSLLERLLMTDCWQPLEHKHKGIASSVAVTKY